MQRTVRPVGGLRPGDHAWLPYGGERERRHVAGAFIAGGLAAGDRVICLSDEDPADLPGVRSAGQRRRGRRSDGDERGTPWGAPVVIPSAACRTDGRFDLERTVAAVRHELEQADRDGHRAIRIVAEMTWAMSEPRAPELFEACERRFDAVIGPSVTITAICLIDRRRCTADMLEQLGALHQVLVEPDPEFEDPVLRITRTFRPYGLSLSGELDSPRHAVFSEALLAVMESADGERVHLDLAGLRFMDLEALVLIVRMCARGPRTGPLVLDHLPPRLLNVLDLLGWNWLPGIEPGDVATTS